MLTLKDKSVPENKPTKIEITHASIKVSIGESKVVDFQLLIWGITKNSNNVARMSSVLMNILSFAIRPIGNLKEKVALTIRATHKALEIGLRSKLLKRDVESDDTHLIILELPKIWYIY